MIDFKEWKKTSEDKQGVEMTHPKGHSMYILYKGVPAIQKEALKRLPLAEGGQVKGIHKSEYDKPAKEIKNKYEKHNAGESKAGEHTRKSSESKSFNKELSREEAINSHHQVLGEMQSIKPKLKGLADGGEVQDQKPQAPVVVNVGTPNQQQVSPAAQQAAAPVEVKEPPVQQQNPNVLLPNGSMSAPGSAQTAQQAVEGQQAIDTSKTDALVPLEQAKLKAIQLNAQQDQNNINALRTHADNLAQNIKSIDPDAYRKNMATPAKVATGIGLFLGGLSTPFGGTNFAADFLNKQIDRDIESQKLNNENQKTIWGAYNSLYGNETIASTMAKASMVDAYKAQIDQIAAKLGTPQALVNAQKLKANLAPIQNKAILDSAGNLSSLPNNPSRSAKAIPDQGSNMRHNGMPQGSIGMGEESNASIKPSIIEKDQYADTGILAPDAQQKLDELRYTPKAKDEIDQIKAQYNNAQKADILLSQLHDLHQHLYKNAVEGGSGGYFRRHDPTSTIPFVGDAVSRTLVQPLTANATNKEYDSMKTRITGDIANALRGTNIGQEEIQHIVDRNSPEPKDTPELVEKKERAIRLFIKNSVDKSLLKDWKLTK